VTKVGQRLASVRKSGTEKAFYANGFRIATIMGAEPEGETGTEGEKPEGTTGSTGTEGSEGSEGDSKEKESPEDVTERLRRVEERMKAADRRATEAEKKVKEYEDKDKSDTERSAERIKELEAATSAKDKEIRDLRLQNAFLSSNDQSWHDPDLAVQHADLSEVLNDDGSVDKKALKRALDALAKDKPFLVKATTAEPETPGGPSGEPVGTGKTKSKKTIDEDALRKKYPSLYV